MTAWVQTHTPAFTSYVSVGNLQELLVSQEEAAERGLNVQDTEQCLAQSKHMLSDSCQYSESVYKHRTPMGLLPCTVCTYA